MRIQFRKITFLFLAAITLNFVVPNTSVAQDTVDFSDLVTETTVIVYDVEGVPNIGHVKALALQKNGAIFIDVRRTVRCELSRVPGAICLRYNLTNQQFTQDALAAHVSKDQKVVFYGYGLTSFHSAHASALALSWGYTDVAYFAGGFDVWRKSDYAIERQ